MNMKLAEAMAVIAGKPQGYRVHFERVDGGLLISDYFPDRDEPLIPTEGEAWGLAERFAKNTAGVCVNLYVVDEQWRPVRDYQSRKIANRRAQ
jgi:hypothetical protein